MGLFAIFLLLIPPIQDVSSFTLNNSGNGPAVNQEDHHDDDEECDPAVYDCTTDSDGDGEPDYWDDCPNEPGTYENYGCPDGTGSDDGTNDDPDGDGIVGDWDDCPNDPAYPPNEVRGCPDDDGDGVANFEDQCPGEMEDWMGTLDGCATQNDSDGDGIPDDQDNCPNTGNSDQADFNNDGSGDVCSDADGDGYYDSFDQCPADPHPNDDAAMGCPPADSDGDGINDDVDSCPSQAENFNGYQDTDGCPDTPPPTGPIDSDGDGINDDVDSCPSQAENFNGYQDTDGCPDTIPVKDSDNDGIPDNEDACPFEPEDNWTYDPIDGCPDAAQPDETDPWQDYYDGVEYYESGNYQQAINSFFASLEIFPDDYDTYGYLAASYYALEQSEDAIDVLKTGLQYHPNDPEYLSFIEFLEQRLSEIQVDTDGDGYSDWYDDCPEVYGTMDGCPDEMPSPQVAPREVASSVLSVDVASTFYEYVSYPVRGSLTENGAPLSGKNVSVLLSDAAGNTVTSQTVTTESDGSFWATVGAGSFPGPHVLKISYQGSPFTKNIQVNPLNGAQPLCQGYSKGNYDHVDINSPVNDANCVKMRYGDKVTHDGTVQYGQQIQFLAKSMRYNYPDRALIEIYNPCGKLVYEAPVQISTASDFWPKVTASGTSFDMTGVYEFVSYHEQSGREILSTTFTVQAGGEHVSGPDHRLCTGSTPGGPTDTGSGQWKGVLTGYGDFYYDRTDHYVYSIEGTFFFDILDDESIEGNGVGSMHISKSWGYTNGYSCWSRDNEYDRKSASYQIYGYVENDKIHLWLGDGSPDQFTLLIWCDIPGFHQDFHTVWSPFTYGFTDDAILDMKQGAETTVNTETPFDQDHVTGSINWNFKITEAGAIPAEEVIAPTTVTPPTKPKISPPPPPPPVKEKSAQVDVTPTAPPPKPPQKAPVPIPTAPKKPDLPPPSTATSLKELCEQVDLEYNPITKKCIVPTSPPTVTPPKVPTTPPQVPTTPAPTVPTPVAPVTPVTLFLTTDRPTYNQGNLVTISSQIFGTTSTENIAITVTDPLGSAVLSRSVSTNNIQTIPFKISQGSMSGDYKVTAVVNVDGQSIQETTQFNVKGDLAGISIVSVEGTTQQGNPISSFAKDRMSSIKVKLKTDSFHPNALVTVNLMDSDLVTLGTSSIQTTITGGESEMILSFFIPRDASEGTANIYANVFSDWPSNSGTPLTKEAAATITIGSSGTTSQPAPQPAPPTSPIAPPTTPVAPPIQTEQPKTVTVNIVRGSASPGCEATSNCYTPSVVTINSGDTVKWSNPDAAAHTATSGTLQSGTTDVFDSGLFMAGETFEHKFDTSGTFDYFCMIHPWMEGKVIVR